MTDTLQPALESERKHGPDEVVEHRVAGLEGLEFRDTTETGDGTMTLSGHAAVFERLSLPLYDWQFGQFNERIARGAFEAALNRNPDVHLVIGHDMTRVLARTQSKTLELREDPAGLRVFARIDPALSFASDLRIQMKRGDVDQMSFAFTVQRDEWLIENPETPEERVIRTITEVGELYDVSVVAQGAYPQTDAQLRSLLEHAAENGRVALRTRSLPRRSAPNAEGGESDRRSEPNSEGGLDLRQHRIEVMRKRLALAQIA
jgi:HK97 family phage prohead protease